MAFKGFKVEVLRRGVRVAACEFRRGKLFLQEGHLEDLRKGSALRRGDVCGLELQTGNRLGVARLREWIGEEPVSVSLAPVPEPAWSARRTCPYKEPVKRGITLDRKVWARLSDLCPSRTWSEKVSRLLSEGPLDPWLFEERPEPDLEQLSPPDFGEVPLPVEPPAGFRRRPKVTHWYTTRAPRPGKKKIIMERKEWEMLRKWFPDLTWHDRIRAQVFGEHRGRANPRLVRPVLGHLKPGQVKYADPVDKPIELSEEDWGRLLQLFPEGSWSDRIRYGLFVRRRRTSKPCRPRQRPQPLGPRPMKACRPGALCTFSRPVFRRRPRAVTSPAPPPQLAVRRRRRARRTESFPRS